MNRNKIRVSRLGADKLKAQMLFVCVRPQDLKPNFLHKIIGQSIGALHTPDAEHPFRQFTVFVEDHNATNVMLQHFDEAYYGLPGSVTSLSIAKVRDVIAEKLRHADPAWRKAGNVSTHAPTFLTADMLVLIVGSRRFLAEIMDLNLEREGYLRKQNIEMLKIFCDFEPVASKSNLSSDNCLHLILREEVFYEGNFNELARRHGPQRPVLRDEDILERFSEETHESDESIHDYPGESEESDHEHH